MGCGDTDLKRRFQVSWCEIINYSIIRDRPFNLQGVGGYGFLFRSEKCFRTTRALEFFFCRYIRLYDKNSESDFFFLHQNQNIFFSNIGNQNIFLEKKHNPPPLVLVVAGVRYIYDGMAIRWWTILYIITIFVLVLLYCKVGHFSSFRERPFNLKRGGGMLFF